MASIALGRAHALELDGRRATADRRGRLTGGLQATLTVISSRLSEDPVNRVLLIEAGSDFAPGTEPQLSSSPRARALFAQDMFWPGLMAEAASKKPGEDPGAVVPLATPMVMGGGSSINGMHAQRGEASDYDEWRQLGVVGWGWDEVMPYFTKLETDHDFDGPGHGSDGPIQIRRFGAEHWSELSKALARVLTREGIPYVEDVNLTPGQGHAPVPLNALERRSSAAVEYLTPTVRARGNLTILSRTQVRRVLIVEGRTAGVETEGGDVYHAPNVILSAGATLSPAILQRSGIGPGAVLADAGIPCFVDRAGVGRNLEGHPLVNVTTRISPRARATGKAPAPCLMVTRFSSGRPNCPPADMILNLWERVPGPMERDPLFGQMANFMVILNKSYSKGSISLNPADPFGMPNVRTGLLDDERDRSRMVDGFRYVARLTLDQEFNGLVTDSFAQLPSPLMYKMLAGDWQSRLMSEVGSLAFSVGPLRRKILKGSSIPIVDLLADDAALEDFVVSSIHPGGHPGGTCRMGDEADSLAVTDSRARVIGVSGLRVADASIFPTLMRSGTNIPAIMAGEKVAAMIRKDGRC